MTADEMLKAMPTDKLMDVARSLLTREPRDKSIDAVVDALALQSRTCIAVIAALAGRSQ